MFQKNTTSDITSFYSLSATFSDQSWRRRRSYVFRQRFDIIQSFIVCCNAQNGWL